MGAEVMRSTFLWGRFRRFDGSSGNICAEVFWGHIIGFSHRTHVTIKKGRYPVLKLLGRPVRHRHRPGHFCVAEFWLLHFYAYFACVFGFKLFCKLFSSKRVLHTLPLQRRVCHKCFQVRNRIFPDDSYFRNGRAQVFSFRIYRVKLGCNILGPFGSTQEKPTSAIMIVFVVFSAVY